MREVRLDAVRRIAVFRALHLGDLLLAVPAWRAIRRRYPDAEVTLVGLPWARSFTARFSRYIDRFLEFPGFPGIVEAGETHDPERTERFLADARAYGYDLVIQMQGSGRTSNPFALALGGRATVGYYEDSSPEGLDIGAPYPDFQPEVLRNLGLARLLGCDVLDVALEFPLYAADEAEADALVDRFPGDRRPLVGIHPGSRSSARRWAPERFAAVADELVRGYNARVLVTGAREEHAIAAAVARAMTHPAHVVAGATSLGGMAALIGRLDLFLCNDTGPSHLADAMGTRSVTIFGPTDPVRWAPLDRSLHKVVRISVSCGEACGATCAIDHRCLAWLEPEPVVRLACEVIDEPRPLPVQSGRAASRGALSA